MKALLITLALATILLTSGCSTIVSNQSDVLITTEPIGTKCDIWSDKDVVVSSGNTPYKATVDNSEDTLYVVCDNNRTNELDSSINGWISGNIIFGGIIGIIVDIATGNSTNFDDTYIDNNGV